MNFGDALAACKAGARITRPGWNGINANTAQATGLPPGTVCRFLPYLMFRTAQGDFVPWLASQTDILAGDWQTAA